MKFSLHERAAGILLHPTSLPGGHGIGDLGPESCRFADFLAAGKQRWWQMLPVVPPGPGDSPYSSLSAFAGSPWLVSLDRLADEGLVEKDQLQAPKYLRAGPIDFESMRIFKGKRFERAFLAFEKRAGTAERVAFDDFRESNRHWLDDYALFEALRFAHRGKPWWQWDKEVRSRTDAGLAAARKEFSLRILYESFLQFKFDQQWKALRQYCHDRRIGLIGDMPIFVAHDSAEVWARPGLFWLDDHGRALKVAGVPPDYFSKTGQLWGNPLYRWDLMKTRGYEWWIMRFRETFKRFDAVRLDHFIGFHNYWEIPGDAKTAERGRWVLGPGKDFFEKIFKALGDIQLIAEDLGAVTPEVKALRDRFNLPGMRVLQFAFGNDPEADNYKPHNYPKTCVAYTGTHDNDTTVGWFRDRGSRSSTRSPAQILRERRTTLGYLKSDGRRIHWDMIKAALDSKADLAIAPAQDLLGLGSAARMNRPGVPHGNWKWRLKTAELKLSVAKRLASLTQKAGRSA